MVDERCGSCIHAKPMPNNLQQKICRGAPPQVVSFPTPRGTIQIQHHFPIVLATDEACGQYKSKVVLDHINGEVVE